MNRRNASARSARRRRAENTAKPRPTSKGISRKRFLGSAAAGVGAAMVGASGVAHATGETIVMPTGDPATDVTNVSNAVLAGGTVILKHVPGTPFNFGDIVSPGTQLIRPSNSVTVTGETDGIPTPQFPNGTPLTTILGGGGIFGLGNYDPQNPPTVTIKNLVSIGVLAFFGGSNPGTHGHFEFDNIQVLDIKCYSWFRMGVYGHNNGKLVCKNSVFRSDGNPCYVFMPVNCCLGSGDVEFINNDIVCDSTGGFYHGGLNIYFYSSGIIIQTHSGAGNHIIRDNRIEAKLCGVMMYNAENTTISNNEIIMDGDLGVYLMDLANNNAVENNVISGYMGTAGILCESLYNDIEYNNLAGSSLPGWTSATPDGPGCILLAEGTRGNFVRQNIFPAGTTMCDQIMDLDMHLGTVGLPQGSQDAIPGYGVCHHNPDVAQHVQDALANRPQSEEPEDEWPW